MIGRGGTDTILPWISIPSAVHHGRSFGGMSGLTVNCAANKCPGVS